MSASPRRLRPVGKWRRKAKRIQHFEHLGSQRPHPPGHKVRSAAPAPTPKSYPSRDWRVLSGAPPVISESEQPRLYLPVSLPCPTLPHSICIAEVFGFLQMYWSEKIYIHIYHSLTYFFHGCDLA